MPKQFSHRERPWGAGPVRIARQKLPHPVGEYNAGGSKSIAIEACACAASGSHPERVPSQRQAPFVWQQLSGVLVAEVERSLYFYKLKTLDEHQRPDVSSALWLHASSRRPRIDARRKAFRDSF